MHNCALSLVRQAAARQASLQRIRAWQVLGWTVIGSFGREMWMRGKEVRDEIILRSSMLMRYGFDTSFPNPSQQVW